VASGGGAFVLAGVLLLLFPTTIGLLSTTAPSSTPLSSSGSDSR